MPIAQIPDRKPLDGINELDLAEGGFYCVPLAISGLLS
jgi:hypothetical protein